MSTDKSKSPGIHKIVTAFLDAERVEQWEECLEFRRGLLENLAEESPQADLILVCDRHKTIIDKFRPEDYLPGDDTARFVRAVIPPVTDSVPPVLDPALAGYPAEIARRVTGTERTGTDRGQASLPSLTSRASQILRSVFGVAT